MLKFCFEDLAKVLKDESVYTYLFCTLHKKILNI